MKNRLPLIPGVDGHRFSVVLPLIREPTSLFYAEQKKRSGEVYRNRNLQIIFLVTLIAIMGVSVITPALPGIMRTFGLSEREVGLLITLFTLPGVLLTPLLGVWADRFGRKTVLVPALLLFGTAGAACAFTTEFSHLLILRFIQGIGGASLGSLNITLIGDLFEGSRRTAAVGYNTSVLSVGTASYPALGGLLATFGWQYPFMLAALAVPIGVFVLFALESPRPSRDQDFRVYLAGVWKSVRNRQAIAIFVSSTLTFIVLYGPYLAFFPLMLDQSYGAPPALIGLIMSSTSLTTALTAANVGRLSRRFGSRELLVTAYLLYALAMLLIRLSPSIWFFLVPTVVFGIGMGLNTPRIMDLLTGLAPLEYRGGFMSFNGLVLRLGQTLGPIVMGAVHAVWGMDGVYYSGAAIGLGMVFLARPMTTGAPRGKERRA